MSSTRPGSFRLDPSLLAPLRPVALRLGPPAALFAIVLALFAPFFGDGMRGGDYPGHVALYDVLARTLRSDSGVPLWDAFEYAGASFAIVYLDAVLSLVVLAPFAWLWGAETGLGVGAVFALALAAVSMYAWCLEWGGSRAGAFVGGFFYALAPPVFGFLGVIGQIHQPVTMAVVPLVFLAWTRLASQPDRRRVAVAAFVSALLLLDMQRFFMVFPFALLCFATLALTQTPPAGRRTGAARFVPAAAAAAAIAGMLLLLCFPLLPILEERSLLQWHAPEAIQGWRGRFSLAHVLQLVDRNGWLRTLLGSLPLPATAAFPGQWYQGLVAIGFVAAGGVLAIRAPAARAELASGGEDSARRVRLAVTFAVFPIVLALAFGPRSLASRHLELVRALAGAGAGGLGLLVPVALLLIAWAACLLAARSALVARFPGRRLAIDTGLGAFALLLALTSPFEWLGRLVFVYDHVRGPAHFAFPMLGFAFGSAASLVTPSIARRVGGERRLLAVIAAVVVLHVLDVLPYARATSPALSPEVETQLRSAFRALRERPEGRLFDVSGYSPLADWLGASEARRPSVWGWLAWSGTRHTGQLVRLGVGGSLASGRFEDAARVAGLANVRHFTRLAETDGVLPGTEDFEPLTSSEPVSVLENRHTLPYARFAPKLAILSGSLPEVLTRAARLAEAGVASYTLDVDPVDEPPVRADYAYGARARVAVKGAPLLPSWLPPSPQGVAAPCELERERSVEIALRCEFAEPGWLVIAESWSPRWRVSIGGEPRPLLRLDHAFQGVEVAAGPADVRFHYEPSWLTRAGLVVSALAWSALAAYFGRALAMSLVAALARRAD